jgi:hypothetical protein
MRQKWVLRSKRKGDEGNHLSGCTIWFHGVREELSMRGKGPTKIQLKMFIL